MEIIKKDSGSHFDPMLVDSFLRLIEKGVIGKIIETFPYDE